jgi:hypothetical protein
VATDKQRTTRDLTKKVCNNASVSSGLNVSHPPMAVSVVLALVDSDPCGFMEEWKKAKL